MSKQIWRSGAVMVSILAILFTGPVWGQQRYPYDHSTAPQSSKYVQQHIIDVGDIPGHQVRILEIQRTYTNNHPVIMGTKVVESWTHGFSDYVNGVGPAQGYGTWILEDGSKIFLQWTGTSYTESTPTGSRRGTFHGTSRFVGGTGRFAAIRGVLTDATEFDTDPKTGYNRPSSRGEYWLEK